MFVRVVAFFAVLVVVFDDLAVGFDSKDFSKQARDFAVAVAVVDDGVVG